MNQEPARITRMREWLAHIEARITRIGQLPESDPKAAELVRLTGMAVDQERAIAHAVQRAGMPPDPFDEDAPGWRQVGR
jgi:hypothetical protein